MSIDRLAGARIARGSWVLVGALLVIQALACTAAGLPTPTTGQPPDPREILQQGVSRLLALESVAFDLKQEKGTTTLFPGLEMSKASGLVDIPDRFSIIVEAELAFPRSFVEIKIVTIGNQAYITDFLSGEWREVSPGSLPVNFGSIGQTLADIIEAVNNLVLAGTERVGGRETHHIKGTIRSEDLTGLVPGAGKGFTVDLEMWLDQSENMLVQALIVGRVAPTDIPDARRLLTLNDFDVPVDITPPE